MRHRIARNEPQCDEIVVALPEDHHRAVAAHERWFAIRRHKCNIVDGWLGPSAGVDSNRASRPRVGPGKPVGSSAQGGPHFDGLAPRLAAWLILIEAGLVMFVGGRTDGGFYLTLPPVIIVLCLIVIGAGGGRWALLDRVDPPRQRRLERSR